MSYNGLDVLSASPPIGHTWSKLCQVSIHIYKHINTHIHAYFVHFIELKKRKNNSYITVILVIRKLQRINIQHFVKKTVEIKASRLFN